MARQYVYRVSATWPDGTRRSRRYFTSRAALNKARLWAHGGLPREAWGEGWDGQHAETVVITRYEIGPEGTDVTQWIGGG